MTIRLSAARYRTRPLDPRAEDDVPRHRPAPVGPAASAPRSADPAPVAPPARASQAAPSPSPVLPASAPPTTQAAPQAPASPLVDEMPFEPQDDGFGTEAFETARGSASPIPAAPSGASEAEVPAGPEVDGIRREGLTGRQLRMARRLAQKHGLPATSDFDAVRLLRKAGIDPFQKSAVLELVAGDGEDDDPADVAPLPGPAPQPPRSGPAGLSALGRALSVPPKPDAVKLPQTVKPAQLPTTEVRAESAHLAEVRRIQADIATRRRRRLALLMARLAVFVLLPTLIAGWYYYLIATPLYAVKTEFQIQQADPAAVAGLGGLLQNSPLGVSKDSIAVQGYLQSQEAMSRLDDEVGLRSHFGAPNIDTLQRLTDGATESALYGLYKDHVRIAYDPTEGIIKMEVSAADPEVAVQYSQALLRYAEEQVDQMTLRLRDDQMEGALTAYQDAEAKMLVAQRTVVDLQEKYKTISSEVEVSLITSQIATLESQLTQDQLSLTQMESNENPNQARMEPLKRRIEAMESQIAELRSKLTEDSTTGLSVAKIQSELLVAQAEVTTRQLLLSQAVAAMETARLEANRQTRYLTISVNPVATDAPSYPRAFENTLVVMLIFAGIYLMISMTLAILKEQVTA